MMCGLLAPDQGEIRIGGESVRRSPLEIKRRIGVVPQELAIYEDLSARENVTFFAKLYGLKGKVLEERVEEAYVISALADSGEYRLVPAPSAEAARQSVSENKAAAAILIPGTFGVRLLQGAGAEVEMIQMRVDEQTFGLKLAVEQTIRGMNQAVAFAMEAGSAGPDLLQTVERIWIQQQTKQVGVTKTDLGLEVNPAVDMATGILLVFMLSLVTSSWRRSWKIRETGR
ncbi:hypothetical protein [Paenibacillus oceani]|uniref:ABC transporter domain-containing protein n=1 Tax=Paenibacillus oceani TaxID=2772510 RepID=A0A927C669_9BACL|nr:hypothetical protein [Paenibacillus oceani]MBD2861975.1 hypothetical protein [Paenibacillus oceani]